MEFQCCYPSVVLFVLMHNMKNNLDFSFKFFRDRNTGIWDEVSLSVTGVSYVLNISNARFVMNHLLRLYQFAWNGT